MYHTPPPPPPPPHFSWGEEIWGHSTGSGDIVCTGEECGQTLTTNPLQPLPQDQRETGRNQQHTHAWCQVSTAPCACVLAWNPLICMHFAPLHSFPDVTIIKGVGSKLLHVNWLKAWSNNQFLSLLAWSELYSYMYVNMNPLTWPCVRYMCMHTHTHTHTHQHTHTQTHTHTHQHTHMHAHTHTHTHTPTHTHCRVMQHELQLASFLAVWRREEDGLDSSSACTAITRKTWYWLAWG